MTADRRDWAPKFILSESSQGGKFDSNLGGMALRYGAALPGAIGVLESPDNHMPIGMAFPLGRPLLRDLVGGAPKPDETF